MPVSTPSSNLSFAALLKTAGLVSVASAAGNTAVWFIFRLFGPLMIGVGEVVTGSVVGVVAAAVVLAALARWTRRPRRIFVGTSIAVLVLYSLGPVSAALAPYREGAALFNLVTVLATELMHLVSGLLVLATFPRVIDR
jgi:hypothetical protein